MPEKTAKKRAHNIISQINLIVFLIVIAGTGYYLYFFVYNANFREVATNKIYRSAQPPENHLKKWIEQYGIKTIINLRAKKVEDFEQEQLIADQMGVTLVPINLSGRRLITTSEFITLTEILETAQTPILLHCQSGIDRAGTVSALAAFAIGNIDYNSAKCQAFVPPGPWKRKDFSKTRADYIHDYAHISDIFKLYENYCRLMNLKVNNWQQFKHWVIDLKSLEDENIEYKSSYSFWPFFNQGKPFYPVHKLGGKVYMQFAIQLALIFLIVAFINHKLPKTTPHQTVKKHDKENS